MATTRTAQDLVNSIRSMPLLAPVFNSQVSGYSLEPGLSIVNDAMGYFLGTQFPWKFNEIEVQPFYVNSFQQDYATSATNIGYLQSGDVIDINNATPKAQPQLEVVRDLPRASTWVALPPMFYGVMRFSVCWRYNYQLYFGTWGATDSGNGTRGNNPQANQTITPLLSPGAAMPSNPILQIQDTNGNYLVLTTFGTTGNSAPAAPASSAPGVTVTDGTCVWTVVDPGAQGFRIWPSPSQSGVVWQFNLRAQAKPPAPITSLGTLLTPIPDEYFHLFREGCIAMAYAYSAEEKVRAMHEDAQTRWSEKLLGQSGARLQGDREPDSASFVAAGGVVARPSGQMPITPGNPWGVGGA